MKIEIKKIYYNMLRIRMIELAIAKEYSKQEMRCPVHLSVGQEPIAVGVCAFLNQKDKIFSAHRSHAHYLAKGGSLKKMLSELHGKVTGCSMCMGGSMHLLDEKAGLLAAVPIVGSTIPIGVGYAWMNKLKKIKHRTVIFFGEGATETGVFHESINYAALHEIPVIFVCENNLYSVYTHLNERQSKLRNLKKICEGSGLKYFETDGTKIENILRTMKKVLKFNRSSNKPIFIKFDTYRYLEHCGPNNDDDLNYREISEVKYWEKKDFMNTVAFKNNDINIMKIKINKEIQIAFNYARKSKFPPKQNLEKFIYSD